MMSRMCRLVTILLVAIMMVACKDDSSSTTHELTNREKAIEVLNALESGDLEVWENYVSSEQYIQHNLGFPDGRDAVIGALNSGALDGTTVEIQRSFAEGDIVALHTKYFFMGRDQVAFDIFRFENGKIVEHWDNLQDIVVETASGRTQYDGEMTISNKDKTVENKVLVTEFVHKILKGEDPDADITDYISTEKYFQHNPNVADGLDGLAAALEYFAANDLVMEYHDIHMVIAEGNFVLTVSEGLFGAGDHVAFYDLFRVEDGKIVEHWDTIEIIPPESEWANSNGKF